MVINDQKKKKKTITIIVGFEEKKLPASFL